MKNIICILFATFAFSHLVNAAEVQKKKVYKKTQEVSFEAADVDGLVRSPDGAYLNQKKGVKFLPLYKIGSGLDRDIKSSVEHLR